MKGVQIYSLGNIYDRLVVRLITAEEEKRQGEDPPSNSVHA